MNQVSLANLMQLSILPGRFLSSSGGVEGCLEQAPEQEHSQGCPARQSASKVNETGVDGFGKRHRRLRRALWELSIC
jgi:hypothetical protein